LIHDISSLNRLIEEELSRRKPISYIGENIQTGEQVKNTFLSDSTGYVGLDFKY
jgi:hypothetical protein